MCGLLARFSRCRGSAIPLGRMMDLIAHRGPDAAGAVGWDQGGTPSRLDVTAVVESQHVLAHRRLSIIDLDPQANQPFASSDGRFHLVYNGELYNYLELKGELEASGAPFRTSSDTEVLIEAWRAWGPACLERLEGMFAFVIHDSEQRRAYAARDAFGIKPLFIARRPDEILFASELPPLLQRLEHPALDLRSAAQALRWGMNDGSARTMIQGVERLPPGSWIAIDLHPFEVSAPTKYFDYATIEQQDWDFEDARLALRRTFLGSVERHLRSDAPLGFALSGGIDSSAIVCAAHALGRREITTFSYLPSNERISERRWIDIVASHTGATTHFIRPHAHDVRSHLPHVVRHQAEPFASLSIYAQYEVYRKVAQEGFKVILSGQGADELLAGYASYYQAAMATAFRTGRLGSALWRLRLLHDRFGQGYLDALRWMLRLWLPKSMRDRAAKMHLKSRAPWLDVGAMERTGMDCWADLHGDRRLPRSVQQMLIASMEDSLQALLRYDDRNSMAHSVESRVPFLTPEMARLCLSFPEEFFVNRRGITKHIFREAMRGIVPDAILNRTDKIGFAPDDEAWAKGLDSLGSCERARVVGGLVDGTRLEAARANMHDRPGTDFTLLWRALNTANLESAYKLHS